MAEVLLETRGLSKFFKTAGGLLHAVEDVDLALGAGRTLGVVGESGCGKSTLGRTVLRLEKPSAGQVLFRGEDISALGRRQLRSARRDMQMVFQDPYSSLDPRMTVFDLVAEPLREICRGLPRAQARERVLDTMELCGLPAEYADSYPHELDGGRRQRVGLARAMVTEPKFVVCDEPVSALDVSVQAKVINLLEELQDKLGLSYIFISHDLSVVKHISDTVMVMYLGHTMELASKQELFDEPLHPYTKALLDVIPRIRHERIQDKKILQGDVPSPTNPPAGCVFHTRCQHCMKVCCERAPEMREVKPGHKCACHLFDEGLTEEEKTPVSI